MPLAYVIDVPGAFAMQVAAVPLPATGLMLAGGLALMGGAAFRRRRRRV